MNFSGPKITVINIGAEYTTIESTLDENYSIETSKNEKIR